MKSALPILILYTHCYFIVYPRPNHPGSVVHAFLSLYADPRNHEFLLNGGQYFYGIACSCSAWSSEVCVISLVNRQSNSPNYPRRDPDPIIR